MLETLKNVIKGIAPTLAGLLGGPAAGAVVSLIAGKVLNNTQASVENVVTALKSPDAFLKLKELETQVTLKQIEFDQSLVTGQLLINQEEAKSDSLFKSGWRPAIGWIGVIALFNNYVIIPYLAALGLTIPELNLSELMPLIFGVLGLGAYRSYEKIKGVAKS